MFLGKAFSLNESHNVATLVLLVIDMKIVVCNLNVIWLVSFYLPD